METWSKLNVYFNQQTKGLKIVFWSGTFKVLHQNKIRKQWSSLANICYPRRLQTNPKHRNFLTRKLFGHTEKVNPFCQLFFRLINLRKNGKFCPVFPFQVAPAGGELWKCGRNSENLPNGFKFISKYANMRPNGI